MLYNTKDVATEWTAAQFLQAGPILRLTLLSEEEEYDNVRVG